MLRYFYKIASRWYITVPLCSFFLIVSCAREEVVAPAQVSTPKWSGEELFRGVFLLDGPVAGQISTYAKLQNQYEFDKKPEVKQELTRLGDEFIQAINKKNPAFFTEFQREVQSGDHFRVVTALEKGTEMLQYAIQQDAELSKYYDKGIELAATIDLKTVTDEQGNLDEQKLHQIADNYVNGNNDSEEAKSLRMAACSIVGVCAVWVLLAVAQTVAAAVNYAAAVNVAAWAFVWVKTVGPSQPQDQLANGRISLEREMLIQEITDKMAVVTE